MRVLQGPRTKTKMANHTGADSVPVLSIPIEVKNQARTDSKRLITTKFSGWLVDFSQGTGLA